VSELAASVHARTEGNPFFVGQVLRHLLESGQVTQRDGQWQLRLSDDLPEGVREVVGRRLSRLSPATNQVLVVAAVAGAEFDLAVLERLPAAVVGDGDVLDALDEAVTARVLAEVPGPSDRYRFVHALVRETVLAELSSARRARLHRHVAEAVEVVRPTDVTALAHHHAEAARAGDTTKAVDYALRAAAEALVRSSYDEAVAHAERGLQVLELDPEPSIDARVQLLRARVEGMAGCDDGDAAVAAVLEAAPVARAAGDREAFAAIVGVRIPVGLFAGLSPLKPLAEEAMAWLGDDGSFSSTWIQLRTALAGVYEGEGHAAVPQLRDVVARARAHGDPTTLSLSLMTLSMALHGSPNLDEQEAAAVEAEALGRISVDRFAQVSSRLALCAAKVARGRLAGTFDSIQDLEAQLPTAWTKYLVAVWGVLDDAAAGRFDEAEARLGSVLAYGEGAPIAMLSMSADLMWIRREQGRTDELLPMLDGMDGSIVAAEATIAAARAWSRAETGDLDGALAIARSLAADDFAVVPQSWVANAANAWLAETAALGGDAALAAALLPRFEGFEGQLLSAAFVLVVGATDRFRGMCLATLGRHDEAAGCYEAALALEDAAPAPPLAARTRYWFARCLLERGTPGDAERAAQLAAECQAAAELMGMAQLAREAAAL
jgi:tetratricopeptide (TPR) repeat protein